MLPYSLNVHHSVVVSARDFLDILTAESVQLDSIRDCFGEKSDCNTVFYPNESRSAETSDIS